MKLEKSHTFQGHSAAVYGLCEGKSGQTFFSVSGDKFIVEWDSIKCLQTGRNVRLEEVGYAVWYDERRDLLVAGTASGNLHVMDLAGKKELRNLAFHTKGIYDLIFHADTSLLYVAGGDGVLSVWKFPEMELIRAIPLSSEKLRQIALNNENGLVAVASGDGLIRVLELGGLNELAGLDAHRDGATSLAWHPVKSALITGGKDAMLRCWSVEDNYRELVAIPAHRYAIYSIVFDKSAQVFITGSRDGTIKVWDSNELNVVQKVSATAGGHTHSVNKIIRLGDYFLSAGDDKKIHQWAVQQSHT